MPAIEWAAFRERVEQRYRARRVAPATLVKVRQVLKELGEHCPTTAELGDAAINRWVESRPGRAPITVNGMLGYLRKSCRLAVAWGLLGRNPFDAESFRLRVPKARKRRHLTRVEMARLLLHLDRRHRDGWEDGRLHALAMLLCHTGLRAKEALRLKVEDVDLDRGVLEVVARGRLKTVGSEATIPIPPAAIPCLAAWASRCGSEWLFPGVTRSGPWVHGSNGKRPADYLDAAAREAGLPPGTTLLMLRHSLATHARTHFDLSPKEVQQILRHGDEATQEHYISIDLDNLRSAVRVIDFRAVG